MDGCKKATAMIMVKTAIEYSFFFKISFLSKNSMLMVLGAKIEIITNDTTYMYGIKYDKIENKDVLLRKKPISVSY